MKAVVTGGAGFIGSHIAEELVGRGYFVRIIDNFISGKEKNIAPFLGNIDLIKGDIRDFKVCARAVNGMDFVFHQAAISSVHGSIEDPILTNETNITGTLNILLASRDANVQRLVFASSSAVYGDDLRLPKKEGVEGAMLSPYAISKRVGEMYCWFFNRVYNLSTVCLRYFNIFGPRQDPASQYASVISSFVSKMIKDKIPIIFGDGEQTRDFLYVSNVVEANILASTVSSISGEVFNIACGERTMINSLVENINEILDKEIKPFHDDIRPGDIKHSFADISKARKILKYEPLISFSDGLNRTIRWHKEESKE